MKIIVLGNQAKAMSNFWSVLIRHMRRAGHEVVCCAPPGDANAEAALEAQGARVRHYSLDRKGLNPLSDLRTTLELFKLFKDEKPDLLFASTIKPVIYGCMAARAAGIPHIYATITGLGYAFEADSFFKKCVNRLSALLYRTALSGAEGIFFQNEDDIATFQKAGILRPKARVLRARGTGVDTARFAPTPLPGLADDGTLTEPPVFLLVARLLARDSRPLGWKNFFSVLAVGLVPCGLIVVQPDLGTTLLLLMLLGGITLFHGVRPGVLKDRKSVV